MAKSGIGLLELGDNIYGRYRQWRRKHFKSGGTIPAQTDDRRQTDGRPMTYTCSEREREFTFAKNSPA